MQVACWAALSTCIGYQQAVGQIRKSRRWVSAVQCSAKPCLLLNSKPRQAETESHTRPPLLDTCNRCLFASSPYLIPYPHLSLRSSLTRPPPKTSTHARTHARKLAPSLQHSSIHSSSTHQPLPSFRHHHQPFIDCSMAPL